MIPGEVMPAAGGIELDARAEAVVPRAPDTGDRPAQVGGHDHFAETDSELDFNGIAKRGTRQDAAERLSGMIPYRDGMARGRPMAADARSAGSTGKRMGVFWRHWTDSDSCRGGAQSPLNGAAT